MKQRILLFTIFLLIIGLFGIKAEEPTFITSTYKVGESELNRQIELEKAKGTDPDSVKMAKVIQKFKQEAEAYQIHIVFNSTGTMKVYMLGDVVMEPLYRIKGLTLEVANEKTNEWEVQGKFSDDMKVLSYLDSLFDLE